MKHCLSLLSEEEEKEFPINIEKIDWAYLTPLYFYGVNKFYLKIDPIYPLENALIPKNRYEYFEDLKYAFRSRDLQLPDFEKIRQDALNSKHI